MFRTIIGFLTGIFFGTYYDCRPLIILISDTFRQYLPPR